jgi:hypothetical protein
MFIVFSPIDAHKCTGIQLDNDMELWEENRQFGTCQKVRFTRDCNDGVVWLKSSSCYRTGVAYGLDNLAEKEKEEEKAKAIRKEQALLEARKKMEDEDDKSRIKRLDGPGVDVKREESVSVKKEEDVDDKSWLEHLRESTVDVKVEDVKAGLAAKMEGDKKCLPQATKHGTCSL